MRITHRIGVNADARERAAWAKIGIAIPPGFFVFEVSEDDPRWPEIKTLVEKFQSFQMAETKFTAAERAQGKFLVPYAKSHSGYPQPEDGFGYLKATYDLTEYCDACGTGAAQNAPFRFRSAPTWGSRDVIQLNWVFDELFTTPAAHEMVFAPFGVGAIPVVQNRSGAVLEGVVQLDVQPRVDVETTGLTAVVCPKCGRSKYEQIQSGLQPKPTGMTAHLAKSSQWFGSGACGERLMLVSQELRQAVERAKLKGIGFDPCAQ